MSDRNKVIDKNNETKESETKDTNENESLKVDAHEEEEDEPEDDTTLFVKNLNFKTTDSDLKKV